LDERLKDKWWRLNHLYKIKDKAGNLVTFKPNYIQLKHIAERGGHRRNRILKARQFGFTTLYCIDLLDEALWVSGTTCAIIAHEREAADKIFEIVKRAYANLPDELKPRTKTDTVRAYAFTHRFDGAILDSQIYVALKLRSGTVQNLHITEIAFNKDQQELKSGSKQTVPITGRISEETTANGFNEFYDDYMVADAITDHTEQDYKAYFYAWWENPEYTLEGMLPEISGEDRIRYGDELEERAKYNLSDGQLLWRRWKINELRTSQVGVGLSGLQLFKQEYPANKLEAFQSGLGNVFDAERLNQVVVKRPLHKMEVPDGAYKEGFNALWQRGVQIWKLPEAGKEYVVGVDPSDGEGSDFSCIDIWTRSPDTLEKVEQVAQYYGKVRPDEGAEVAKQMAEYYNAAFVGVENNMLSFVLFLVKIYDNYYSEVVIDEKTQRRTKKLGWNTNTKTRDPMVDDFIKLFEEGYLIINSGITLGEMKTFVKKDSGKREHSDGKHDDALIAGMIAMQMRKYQPPRAKAYAAKANVF